MSDTTIRVGHHALYPVTSDDGKRMWASQPEPEAVANDVVFDSDLALIEAMASELASKPSDTTTEWPGEAISPGLVKHYKQAASQIGDLFTWCVEHMEGMRLASASPDWIEQIKERLLGLATIKARLVEVEAERNCLMVTGGSTNPFVVAEAIQRLKERAEAAEARVKELEGQIDANVAAVIAKHRSRADLGMQKYGVATANSDLTKKQWLLHLQEELMDAAVYVEAALAKS